MYNKNNAIGTLYLVATPIGNMKDITFRAVEVLSAVDYILCENTAHSGILLAHHGINAKGRTRTYNDHSTQQDRDDIMQLLLAGRSVGLISDAGTPLISDPGFKLVRSCREAAIAVVTIPGASAVIAALAASGMPTDKFLFCGFLPTQASKLEEELISLKQHRFTLVFYESPKRLYSTVSRIHAVMGDRNIVVARELTKVYEEFIVMSCSEFLAEYAQKQEFKGEIVLVVGGAEEEEEGLDIEATLRALLKENTLRDAVEIVHEMSGLPKKQVYEVALRLKAKI